MRFASLGSGSAGNGLLIQQDQTRLLLDCGFGIRDAIHRLQRLGVEPSQLNGILITHEHDDHASGVFKLAQKYAIPVYLTYGSFKMLERRLPKGYATQTTFTINIIEGGQPFSIHDMTVTPYTVPHDAREPVQFTLGNGQHKLGVLTDAGSTTPHMQYHLNDCDALVLECNHDLDMLMNGVYTWSLKKRVSSRLGHLDNACAADLLARLTQTKLKHVVAAHLSEKNNLPELARQALSQALGCQPEWVGVACQQNGFDWLEI